MARHRPLTPMGRRLQADLVQAAGVTEHSPPADRLRAQLRREPAELRTFSWPTPAPLDQGREGQCVGYAVVQAANVRRLVHDSGPQLGAEDAAELHELAQQRDGLTVPHEGTSVAAGMAAGMDAGLWNTWRSVAPGTWDIAQAVLQLGPVVVGVPWFAGMYSTAPDGTVEVSGAKLTGHALVVVGLDVDRADRPTFVWLNSAGPSYGHGGLGYVPVATMAGLLAGVGEAAVAPLGLL